LQKQCSHAETADSTVHMLPLHNADDAARIATPVQQHLEAGGIIAYPTETVYGFGCLLQRDALADLVALKGRDAHQSFILLSAAPRTMPGLHWSDSATLLAQKFWPGALTLALRAEPAAYEPPVLSGQGTVAVRATPHTALDALLQRIAHPITSTSANLSGEPAAIDAQTVIATLRRIGRDDVLVLDGGTLPASQPSTVVDCAADTPRLLRAGAVSIEELRGVLATRGYEIQELY
jgi:L-threonylcarbamoyladenylate synthase